MPASYSYFDATPSLTTDAAFRSFLSTLKQKIELTGWTQTNDTGQFDLVAGTRPTSATAYLIFKCNDSLSATAPIYIKLLFGVNSTYNWLYFEGIIGTGSDGAGNIISAPNTGTSVTAQRSCSSLAGSITYSSATRSYIIGDDSSLYISLFPYTNNNIGYSGLFGVERRRDYNGVPVGDAMQTITTGTGASGIGGTGTTYVSQCIYMHNQLAQPGPANYILTAVPNLTTLTSSVLNNTLSVYPLFTGFSPILGAPSKFVVAVKITEVPIGSIFTINHYGVSRKFISVIPIQTPSSGYYNSAAGFTYISNATLFNLAIAIE